MADHIIFLSDVARRESPENAKEIFRRFFKEREKSYAEIYLKVTGIPYEPQPRPTPQTCSQVELRHFQKGLKPA